MKDEYQAVIVCTFCKFHGHNVNNERHVLAHPDGPFATAQEAVAYGWAMLHNVYGASTHRIELQRRQVSEWVGHVLPV